MIAISYRREDSAAVTGRLYDRLETEFGKGNVFMDFDSIPYGVDFREHIKQSLAKAEVLVVVIGPQWFGKSQTAKNRIHEPNDFVRVEIAEALKRDIPVIPVLVNNTPMPSANSLPEEIQAVSYRNGLALDSAIDFHHHVNRLVSGIKKLSGAKSPDFRQRQKRAPRARIFNRRRIAFAAATLLILLGAAAVWYIGLYFPAKNRATAIANATKEHPWENRNSLGMKFVPVPITGGSTGGKPVLFSIWDTRVKDFAAFINESGYDMSMGDAAYTLESDGKGGGTWKQAGGDWKDPHVPAEASQTDEHPVVCVSWNDAQAFCKWLTEREHRSGQLPKEWSYRLPSDHEWSCAVGIGEREDATETPEAKNGTIQGIYPWGRQWPPPRGAGNYAGEESRVNNWPLIEGYRDGYPRTSPVGSFKPNEYGLYDMGGNVWQWCQDKYTPGAASRVVRGASWHPDYPSFLLSSFRADNSPTVRCDSYGFRVVVAGSASAH